MTDGLVDNRSAGRLQNWYVPHISLLDWACVLLDDGDVRCVRLDHSPQTSLDDWDMTGASLNHWLAVPLQYRDVTYVLLLLLGVHLVDHGDVASDMLSASPEAALNDRHVTDALVDDWTQATLYLVCNTLGHSQRVRVQSREEARREEREAGWER